MRVALLLSLFVAAPAMAVPLEFSHQGRVFDALGNPVASSETVFFRIYDTPSGGTSLWEETHTIAFDNGYFGVPLGQTTPLDPATFDGDDLWLTMQVGSGAELPTRIHLASVPYAFRALSADSVAGGAVDATEISVGGTTVIDTAGQIDWTSIANPPTETLIALGCVADQIALHDGSGWTCAGQAAHVHAAGDVTNGVFDTARLPVGIGSSEVAAGDHVHDAAGVVSGILNVGRLPVGTTASDVAAGDHSHTAADVGALPSSGGTLTGDLIVQGGVAIGDTSSDTCDATVESTLRWHTGKLEICDGTVWQEIAFGGPDGSSPASAGDSCNAILADFGSSPSGPYWIDPTGSAPIEVYCDMVTDGGGWTFVGAWGNRGGYDMYSHRAAGLKTGEVVSSWSTPRPGGSGAGQGPTHYSDAVINTLFNDGDSEYLSLVGRGAGGHLLTKHSKNTPDLGYDAYRGVYQTSYMAANGFTAVKIEAGGNSNPLPVASPGWQSVATSGRGCANPPGGIGCYHYLPDDITGGGQWLFRENLDNTPFSSYGGSSNVPSLLFIR